MQIVEFARLKVFCGHFSHSLDSCDQYIPAVQSQFPELGVDVEPAGQNKHRVELTLLYVFSPQGSQVPFAPFQDSPALQLHKPESGVEVESVGQSIHSCPDQYLPEGHVHFVEPELETDPSGHTRHPESVMM